MIVSSKVTAKYKQVLITDYLADRFTYRSKEEWLVFVQNGRVQHNHSLCTPDTLVTQGDVVSCQLPEVVPPANFNYTILYEDDWLLAINKPGDLLVHDKKRFSQANLIYHLRHKHHPPYPSANLVNRLDKDTSGIVIVAKDGEKAAALQQLFREQAVSKQYLAVVNGVPSSKQGEIDLPIGKIDSLPGVYRFGVVPGGKTAVTHYKTLQTFDQRFALLQLSPQTGRTHQIRVHLQAIGHPLIGDKLYQLSDEAYLAWVQKRSFSEADLIQRQALHCSQTSFNHPQTERPFTITAPLPPDFESLLQKLEQKN